MEEEFRGEKKIMSAWGNQARSLVGEADSESTEHRKGGRSTRLDLKTSGTKSNWAAWKERTRSRTKAMTDIKGRITKGEGREEEEWKSGVTEKNIQELALTVKAVFGSQEAPASVY